MHAHTMAISKLINNSQNKFFTDAPHSTQHSSICKAGNIIRKILVYPLQSLTCTLHFSHVSSAHIYSRIVANTGSQDNKTLKFHSVKFAHRSLGGLSATFILLVLNTTSG